MSCVFLRSPEKTRLGPFRSTDSGVTTVAARLGEVIILRATRFVPTIPAASLPALTVQLPTTLDDADWPIRASMGGVVSPAGTILTVRQ